MMTGNIALDVRTIRRFVIACELAVGVIVVIVVMRSIGDDNRMVMTTEMIVRQGCAMSAAHQDSKSKENHGDLADHSHPRSRG